MRRNIRLGNKYKAALLEYFGLSGVMIDDEGFQRWEFEDSPELQELLHSFEKDQPINLRGYVDCLRRAEGQLKNARFNGKKERPTWDRTQQERV